MRTIRLRDKARSLSILAAVLTLSLTLSARPARVAGVRLCFWFFIPGEKPRTKSDPVARRSQEQSLTPWPRLWPRSVKALEVKGGHSECRQASGYACRLVGAECLGWTDKGTAQNAPGACAIPIVVWVRFWRAVC